MTQAEAIRGTQWPEGAKYCVHIYRAATTSSTQPTLIARRFTPTLLVPDAPYPDFRLRKSKVRGWWMFMGSWPRGWWWAKAHDRAFDCEVQWPEEAWKVA